MSSFITKYLWLIVLLLVVASFGLLFLPYFELDCPGIINQDSALLSVRPNPDQSGGFFGGGDFYTYSGFGSVFALFDWFLCVVVFLLIAGKILRKSHIKLLAIVFVSSQVLVFVSRIIAPYFLSSPDRMFRGYYSTLLVEITLFWVVYKFGAWNSGSRK